MKIINILLTKANGGLEQVFIDYCIILQDLGHQILSIIDNQAPYSKTLEENNINIIKITNKFGFFDLAAIDNIARIIEEFNADIIFSHAGRSQHLVKMAIKKLTKDKNSKKLFHIAVNHSNKVKRSIGADMIFSVNKRIFYNTIDAGQPENRSFVIHNAIRIDDADLSPIKVNLSQKSLIKIGVIGRLEYSKGFDNMIMCLEILTKEWTKNKFMLKIAGAGPEKENLISITKTYDIDEKNIEFCGWIDNKKSFFEDIDIFVLPSRSETFGLVILEAMKYRKPVISTRCDGPLEIINHMENGILTDHNNENNSPYSLFLAIKSILDDDELATKIVNNASQKLQKRFSYQILKRNLGYFVGDKSKLSN